MTNNKIKPLYFILIALITFNLVCIGTIDYAMAKPASYSTVELMGAVFATENNDPNVIEISLVQPPRKTVNPGEEAFETSSVNNTAEFPVYYRAAYRVDVTNAETKIINGWEQEVEVKMNKDWEYRDGYWYYSRAVEPGESIANPIHSITYSDAFGEHRDYKVYIPLAIECVEARDKNIEDITYWDRVNVEKVKYEDCHTLDRWKQTVSIIQYFGG